MEGGTRLEGPGSGNSRRTPRRISKGSLDEKKIRKTTRLPQIATGPSVQMESERIQLRPGTVLLAREGLLSIRKRSILRPGNRRKPIRMTANRPTGKRGIPRRRTMKRMDWAFCFFGNFIPTQGVIIMTDFGKDIQYLQKGRSQTSSQVERTGIQNHKNHEQRRTRNVKDKESTGTENESKANSSS